MSFHATKLFHTIEGGAVITNDDQLAEEIRQMINFGFVADGGIELTGTNAKMNEFEAAMGLCVLDEIDNVQVKRKHIWHHYQCQLEGLVSFQVFHQTAENNFCYAPVLFSTEAQLLNVQKRLVYNDIIPRRYFYPSLDTLKYVNSLQVCKNSRDISTRILCLPLYSDLSENDLNKITQLIKSAL